MAKTNSVAALYASHSEAAAAVEKRHPPGLDRQLTSVNLASALSEENIASAYAALLEDHEALRTRLERENARGKEPDRALIAQALLALTDDLERALSAVAHVDEDSNQVFLDLTRGIRLSLALLYKRIANLGAVRMSTTGRYFEPRFALAIETVDVSSPSEHGIVVEEVRPGYRVGDRLLRAAQVRVGRFTGT